MASFAVVIDVAMSALKLCNKCYKCCAKEKKDTEDDGKESEDGSDTEEKSGSEEKTKTKSRSAKTRKKREAEYKPVKQNEPATTTSTAQPHAQPLITTQPVSTTVENHFNPVFNIINSPYAPLPNTPELPGMKPGSSTSASPRPGDGIIKWIPSTIDTFGGLLQKAVVGGYDIDGSDLWIIRTSVYGEMIPGKLNVEQSLAFYAHKRKDTYVEKNTEAFQVCCVAPEHSYRIVWIQFCDGSLPKNAIVANTKDSEQPLYIGRKLIEDKERKVKSLCPGMIHPDRGLYITFALKVHLYNTFEVMCLE